MQRRVHEQPGPEAIRNAPDGPSAPRSVWDSDLKAEPAADITFVDQEPPLRAVRPAARVTFELSP